MRCRGEENHCRRASELAVHTDRGSTRILVSPFWRRIRSCALVQNHSGGLSLSRGSGPERHSSDYGDRGSMEGRSDRSPLMFGGHLPDNDDFTLSLLTNDEVVAVDQKASSSEQLFANGNQVAWVAEIPGSKAKCRRVQYRRCGRRAGACEVVRFGIAGNVRGAGPVGP